MSFRPAFAGRQQLSQYMEGMMKRGAIVLTIIVVLLVPIVVQASRSLQSAQQSPRGVGSIHIEIHQRGSGTVIECEGELDFGQNQVASLAFNGAAGADAALCLDVVESVGALDGVRPGEHVTVHAHSAR